LTREIKISSGVSTYVLRVLLLKLHRDLWQPATLVSEVLNNNGRSLVCSD